MAIEKFYPVQKLNTNITLSFKKIISSDIYSNIESGLELNLPCEKESIKKIKDFFNNSGNQ